MFRDAMTMDLYGNYRNLKFTDVWNEANDFAAEYNESALNGAFSDPNTINIVYHLLYGRYGNSTIASFDIDQFKYKVFSVIFMYGPTWEKRLEVQKAVRELDLDQLMEGGKAVYNTALNPGQPVRSGYPNPSGEGTNTLDELTYINQQNTTKYKKSKVDAYGILMSLLETDVTAEFLERFKSLFLKFVTPELPLWYIEEPITEGEDDE